MHFLFRLCLHFRWPHPAVIDRHLTREQLADWWLYYQHDPWGERRADYRAFCSQRIAENAMPEWPYVEPPFTADEIQEALRELK